MYKIKTKNYPINFLTTNLVFLSSSFQQNHYVSSFISDLINNKLSDLKNSYV